MPDFYNILNFSFLRLITAQKAPEGNKNLYAVG